MPFKSHKKSTGGKRPSMAKAKKMVSKSKSKAMAKNMDTFSLRATTLYNQIPTQGVVVSNYVYGATNLLGGNLLNNAEFNFYRLQYDQYRVNSVRLSCTPKANMLDAVSAQQDASYTLTGDGMVHTCIDRDGLAVSSIANISRYPSYRPFSLLKKWSRRYACTWPKGIWLDCNSTNQDKLGLIDSLGLNGGITFYAENLPEDSGEIFNEPWAEIRMEFHVVFRGKVSGNLSFTIGEDGIPSGVSLTAPTGEALKPLSTLFNVRGSIADNLLLETVEEDATAAIDDGGNT